MNDQCASENVGNILEFLPVTVLVNLVAVIVILSEIHLNY